MREFPSPCGVWVVSMENKLSYAEIEVSVPLRGVGCFKKQSERMKRQNGFRPLAGCGLFLADRCVKYAFDGFRPLAGCGLFQH